MIEKEEKGGKNLEKILKRKEEEKRGEIVSIF